MKCFFHPTKHAVGVCTACGRAYCVDCHREYQGKHLCRACFDKLNLETPCAFHPDREACGLCVRCKRHVCEACIVEHDDQIFCKECSPYPQSPVKTTFLPLSSPHLEKEKHPTPTPPPVRSSFMVSSPPSTVSSSQTTIHRSRLLAPAAVGGIFFGVLLSIPLVNLLIPLWFIGPLITLLLLFSDVGTQVPSPSVKRVGELMGVCGAFVGIGFYVLINVFFGSALFSFFSSFLTGVLDLSSTTILLIFLGIDPSLDIFILAVRFIVMTQLFPFLGGILAPFVANALR